MQNLSHRRLIELMSSAYPGLVAYIDTDYKFRFVNDNFYEWFNLSKEQVIGKTVTEIMQTDDLPKRLEIFKEVLGGRKVKYFTKFKHNELGMRDVEVTYSPDKSEDESIQGFVAMAYDITELKAAQKSAQDNEARFRSLTEVMPQLIWIVDAEGQAIFLNNNWSRITSTKLEDNLGYGWLNVIHPEDRVTAVLGWKTAIKNSTIYEAEYRIKMSNGLYRWHIARGIPIKNDDGIVERWVGTTTDIEVHKNARVLADNERERFYSIFMQSPVATCVLVGPEHYFDLANPSAKKLFGNKSLRGLSLKVALPELEEQGYNKIFNEVYHSGKGCFIQAKSINIVQNDGTVKEHIHDLFCEAIKDENGLTTGILVMSIDVNEQFMALKNMEEALKTRDQFLSIASHELKTPLTSLKLQSQLTLRMLNKEVAIPQERQRFHANQVNDWVSKLTRLIDDMLDVSRIRTGKLQLNRSRHEIGDVVREVVFKMGLLFESAGLNLPTVTFSSRMSGEWDRFRIEQVISNLLTNAIRYGKGKPIQIIIARNENFARVSVVDQGYGIDSEDLLRIFGRFERAIHSSEVSGLGLGLFISKEIIETHGGSIFAESSIGKGSTFTFEIPFDELEEA